MNRPINEQDEFLLSRLLDEDLSPEEATALRARMEREPELRAAYAAMTRIDSLLAARRADQPQVDWSRFHGQVMNQVETEAARRVTIRLADFLRVALPLAAAAAIALVVALWPRGGRIQPGPHGNIPGPAVADSGSEIRYYHPESADTGDTIRVSYARSDELSQEYRAIDDKARSQESSQTFLAGNVRPAQSFSPELLAQISPLF